MSRYLVGLSALLLAIGCSSCSSRITDPVPDIPLSQQRVITRVEQGWTWPFDPGVGTLACSRGAILFRAGGVIYGLNAAARNKGGADPEPIRLVDHSAQPSDPVRRLTQETRMRIFQDTESCGPDTGGSERASCEARVADESHISPSELARIEVEGHERAWPPLRPPFIAMDAVLSAGAALCPHR